MHETIPGAGHVDYAASKARVKLMLKTIAQEGARYRIRVESICQGAHRTPINTDAGSTHEAYSPVPTLIPN